MAIKNKVPCRAVAIALFAAATVVVGCGDSSPSTPTGAPGSLSSVTLGSGSVAVGSGARGTVTVLGVAPLGGMNIVLSSSDALVASVDSPVVIPAGASSVSFGMVARRVGTATITASAAGTERRSPMMTITAQVVRIDAISFAPARVVGGRSTTGTVVLTAPAPDGGAVVEVTAEDPLVAPAVVVVPAHAISQTFEVTTPVVGSTTQRTLTATYGGSSASSVIEMTRSTDATARFGVTGPSLTETCQVANGGLTLNCTFNGTTSTAPGAIVAWDWSWAVATKIRQTTTEPVLSMPAMDCSLLPAPPFNAGVDFFTMIVGLTIHDNLGNVSPEATDTEVRLFPSGTCGF